MSENTLRQILYMCSILLVEVAPHLYQAVPHLVTCLFRYERQQAVFAFRPQFLFPYPEIATCFVYLFLVGTTSSTY